MNYNVKIEVNAEEVVNQLGATELVELTKELVFQYFDLKDILEVARESYTEAEILEGLDIDEIIDYVKKEGYNVSE